MFFGLSALVFMPLLLRTYILVWFKKIAYTDYYALIWLTAATIATLFFFVNTQMHERYSYPAIALYFAYALMSGQYSLFALISVAHLANVDGMNKYFGLNPFKPEYTALLFGLILMSSFIKLFMQIKNIRLEYAQQTHTWGVTIWLNQVIIVEADKIIRERLYIQNI